MKKIIVLLIVAIAIGLGGYIMAANIGTANSVRGSINLEQTSLSGELTEYYFHINAQQGKDYRPARGSMVQKISSSDGDRTLKFDVRHVSVSGKESWVVAVCTDDSQLGEKEGKWLELYVGDGDNKKALNDKISWEWFDRENLTTDWVDDNKAALADLFLKQTKGDIVVKSY